MSRLGFVDTSHKNMSGEGQQNELELSLEQWLKKHKLSDLYKPLTEELCIEELIDLTYLSNNDMDLNLFPQLTNIPIGKKLKFKRLVKNLKKLEQNKENETNNNNSNISSGSILVIDKEDKQALSKLTSNIKTLESKITQLNQTYTS